MSENRGSGGFRPSPKQIGGGILVVVALVLVLQNTQSVRVELLFWNVEWPLWIVLLLMLVIGAAIGYLASWRARRR